MLAPALAAVAAACAARRVAVAGTSMLPALCPGDRLLVVKGLPLRPGRVVAVTDPRDPRRTLVKRVHAVAGRAVDVRGDNEAASTDSRRFGPVGRELVVGTVIYRYGPAGRIGWWPGGTARTPGRATGRR